MRIDWYTLALQLINFAILVWLLQRFLYRPVLRVVDARRAAVDERYAEAARAEEAAKRQLSELAAQRAGLSAERATALERAQEEARQAMAARRAQAEHDAQGLLDEARRTLAQERERVLAETRRTALDLAAGMARRELAAGRPLRVVTARPMPAEAQERWRTRLRESLGPDVAISFDSEPGLIGGAELRFPCATLSFSVQSTLETLQEEARRDDEPR
jgi:F-type H+-transporting ATPase subunit b